MRNKNVKEFYNRQASKWSSDEFRTISDLVGRSAILDICNKIARNKVVLDLGCGEGYIGRKVAKISKKLIGVDLSGEMINLANLKKGNKEEYFVSDMNKLKIINKDIDLVIAVMAIHYLKESKDLVRTFKEIRRVLKDDGEFIFLIPHPLGALINEKSKNYIHDKFEYNYAKDEGKFFEYKVRLLKHNDLLEVGFYFHRLSTYMKALKQAGFVVTDIIEPYPTKEMVKKYKADIEEKIPYYLIIRASQKN